MAYADISNCRPSTSHQSLNQQVHDLSSHPSNSQNTSTFLGAAFNHQDLQNLNRQTQHQPLPPHSPAQVHDQEDINYWLKRLSDDKPLAQLIADPWENINGGQTGLLAAEPIDLSSSITTPGSDSIPSSDNGNRSSEVKDILPKEPKEKLSLLPPCRVCNKPASGFHYGVNSCEACKTFFRRTLLPNSSIKPCKKKNNSCLINPPKGKISCASCRYQKCIAVGMDKEGCKKGRYTYAKRLSDLQEVQSLELGVPATSSATQCSSDNRSDSLEDSEHLVMAYSLRADFEKCFPDISSFYHQRRRHMDRINIYIKSTPHALLCTLITGDNQNTGNELDESLELVISKSFYILHKQSSLPFTSENLPTIKEHFISYIEKSLEQLIIASSNFAKKVKGFNSLTIEDRMILMKAAFTELLTLVRWIFWRSDIDYLIRYDRHTDDIEMLSGTLLKRILVDEDYWNVSMRCAMRMQKMELNIQDIALLSSIIILSPDREGLQDTDKVESLQNKLITGLALVIQRNHQTRKDKLTQCLLLLPALRECSIKHHRALQTRIRELNLQESLSIFIREMLQVDLPSPL